MDVAPFSRCPVAPGDSLLFLERGTNSARVVSAVTFAGQDDAFCVALFGLNDEADQEPLQLDIITTKLTVNKPQRVGSLEIAYTPNVEATDGKPFLLMINTPGVCPGWRSEYNLDAGQEYKIATVGGTARMTILGVHDDHVILSFADEGEPRTVRSCETFVHGLIICFLVHVAIAGWYFWVANAVSVVREEVPFLTTGDALTARDALLETIESIAAMPVVPAR